MLALGATRDAPLYQPENRWLPCLCKIGYAQCRPLTLSAGPQGPLKSCLEGRYVGSQRHLCSVPLALLSARVRRPRERPRHGAGAGEAPGGARHAAAAAGASTGPLVRRSSHGRPKGHRRPPLALHALHVPLDGLAGRVSRGTAGLARCQRRGGARAAWDQCIRCRGLGGEGRAGQGAAMRKEGGRCQGECG